MVSVRVPKIAIGGGPCAGKTSVLSYLTQELEDKGVAVFVCSEVATELHDSGLTFARLGAAKYQRAILEHAFHKERLWEEFAASVEAERKVILCDRGLMDGAAYVGQEEFGALLHSFGFDLVSVRDGRYDGAIHLVTAAKGAEKFYTSANNAARRETLAEARDLDNRLINAWTGCPHFQIIDNPDGVGFEEKKRRTLEAVCRVLGIPVPIEIERKYLVGYVDWSVLKLIGRTVDIEQFYVKGGGRYRRRGQNGSWIYYHTIKTEISPGIRSEVETQVTASEYEAAKANIEPRSSILGKKRTCFVWENQYFELDQFTEPSFCRGLTLLEIELTQLQTRVSLPPCIQVRREVTDTAEYSNRNLARRPN